VLGNPPPEDKTARGDRLFHTATATFAGQFSCSSCHPHGAHDGLRYDLEPDGIGQNFVDNRNLRGIAGTAPFKWTGTNPDITTQCGSRTAKWIFRTSGFPTRDVVIVSDFIRDMPAVRSPYLMPEGQLSPAQRRGKAFFERTTTNNGDPIPVENRCTTCHAGPKFTDQRQTDIGSTGLLDTHVEYDNAHLNSVFASPPYLHDGRAMTLEEIWTRFNDDDKHGISSDWTKRQLNDLVEYDPLTLHRVRFQMLRCSWRRIRAAACGGRAAARA
jgi:cytochrome c peroxidase